MATLFQKSMAVKNSLKLEHAYQLLEILRAFHHFHVTQGNYELTGHIFDQCMALEKTNNSEELRMSLAGFRIFQHA